MLCLEPKNQNRPTAILVTDLDTYVPEAIEQLVGRWSIETTANHPSTKIPRPGLPTHWAMIENSQTSRGVSLPL